MMLQPLPLPSLLQGSGPTLIYCSAGGEKSRQDAGRKRAAEKNHLLSSARAAGNSPSLFPLPPALWQLLSPRLLGNSRIWGPGGFQSQAGDGSLSLRWSLPLREPQAPLL